MAKAKDYPSYLPDDFKGLPSIQEGNQRYYYKVQEGKNLLVGSIVGSRHLIIRFPDGSTIVVPPDSVGTEQLIDGAVETEDLNQDVIDRMTHSYDADGEGIKIGGFVQEAQTAPTVPTQPMNVEEEEEP